MRVDRADCGEGANGGVYGEIGNHCLSSFCGVSKCASVGRRVLFVEDILVCSLIGRKLRRSHVILE